MWGWLFQFIDPLEQEGLPYAMVGSVASSIYGEPRATNDLDLVIQIGTDDAARLVPAFPADKFYIPPVEVVLAELGRARGAHRNIIALEGMTKADLYPLPASQRTWFERRRPLPVAGRKVWVAAPEAVILHKLLFTGRAEAKSTGAMCAPWCRPRGQRWTDNGWKPRRCGWVST